MGAIDIQRHTIIVQERVESRLQCPCDLDVAMYISNVVKCVEKIAIDNAVQHAPSRPFNRINRKVPDASIVQAFCNVPALKQYIQNKHTCPLGPNPWVALASDMQHAQDGDEYEEFFNDDAQPDFSIDPVLIDGQQLDENDQFVDPDFPT